MKKVINGMRYNTETAKKLGRWESDGDSRGLYHEEEELYRTKAGNYFLYCCGGAASRYNEQIGQNEWAGGEKIKPISEERARKWVEERLDGDQYDLLFGGSDGGQNIKVTIYLPEKLAERLTARMEVEHRSRNDMVLEALREFLK
jgi:hypothetical protein